MVTFGGMGATVVSVSPTSLTVITPAHAEGSVDVTLVNPDGGSVTMMRAFSYHAACAIPLISRQPSDVSIIRGASAMLSVEATGQPALSYQWYVGEPGDIFSPIEGATTSSIIVTPNKTTTYWVAVGNSCGSAMSNPATITVVAGRRRALKR
jgi:hypothetical protein